MSFCPIPGEPIHFLLGLKARGFRPKGITTDLLLGYENVVKEVFPGCVYQQCVLHAERDAKRIVRQSLPKEADEQRKEKLVKAIRTLFRNQQEQKTQAGEKTLRAFSQIEGERSCRCIGGL